MPSPRTRVPQNQVFEDGLAAIDRDSIASPQPRSIAEPPRAVRPVVTRHSLRTLLGEVVRSDSDLDAFVGDFFPKVYAKYGDGMDRVRKINILLDEVGTALVLTKLREAYPAEVARNEELIEWEARE